MKRQNDRILKEELPRSVGVNMLLEISGEITAERMKGWSQSKNNTQLWIRLVIESESESEVAQSCPTLRDPMDCSPPGPPSMGFSRQEYWSGLPFPSPGDLPNPGIKPGSVTSPALAGRFFTT